MKWLAESNTGRLWQSGKPVQELLIPIHCLHHKTIVSSSLYYYFVPVHICPHHALLKELLIPLENTSSYLWQLPRLASQALIRPQTWMEVQDPLPPLFPDAPHWQPTSPQSCEHIPADVPPPPTFSSTVCSTVYLLNLQIWQRGCWVFSVHQCLEGSCGSAATFLSGLGGPRSPWCPAALPSQLQLQEQAASALEASPCSKHHLCKYILAKVKFQGRKPQNFFFFLLLLGITENVQTDRRYGRDSEKHNWLLTASCYCVSVGNKYQTCASSKASLMWFV